MVSSHKHSGLFVSTSNSFCSGSNERFQDSAFRTKFALFVKRMLMTKKERVTYPAITHVYHKRTSTVTFKKKKEEEGKLVARKEELDAQSDNPHMCGIYESDIYEYLRSIEVEHKRRPTPDYIERIQIHVTTRVRGVLVNWLVQVAKKNELASQTLFLAVTYLDKVFSTLAVDENQLWLVALTCIVIACKFEDTVLLEVEKFSYIKDNTYTMREVVEMERHILKILNFEMGTPTAKTFLPWFTRVATNDDDTNAQNLRLEFLCCYLAELTLMDYACIRFLPSMIAASATFLANFTIRPMMHPWSLTLQQVSRYRPSDLKNCVLAIHDLQLNRERSTLKAARVKYKQRKFKSVAKLTSPSEVPAEFFEDYKPFKTRSS